MAESRQSQKSFQQSEIFYKHLNSMQEQVIKDLISLMRKSVKDLSLSFVAKSQENIELVKNPLNMIDM